MLHFTETEATARHYRHPALVNAVGFIPLFASEFDPRPVREQFNSNYLGGFDPFEGFTMLPDGSLKYPGDPALPILATAKLRDETIHIYPSAWVAIVQPNGSFVVGRMD